MYLYLVTSHLCGRDVASLGISHFLWKYFCLCNLNKYLPLSVTSLGQQLLYSLMPAINYMYEKTEWYNE